VRSQGGYTLVELIVASAIGLMVMTGLTSVVFSSWRAAMAATSRIEASGQVRNFQFEAYDDFALSGVPTLSNCTAGSPPPCTVALSGLRTPNSTVSVPVTYTWDGANVDRQVGGGAANHAATNVAAFSAFIDAADPRHPTVVVTMTVTVGAGAGQFYSESQTLRFYPRVNP